MLRLDGWDDPLIGRPLALYDVLESDGQPDSIDVVYLVGGKMTSRLAHFESGQSLVVWGPLGNGFPRTTADHLIMVAGGIGQTPFLAVAKEHLGAFCYGDRASNRAPIERITFCFGARTRDLLGGVQDFRRLGIDVRVSTDDGSDGHHGLVTEVLQGVLEEDSTRSRQIYCCGPEPMMEAVSAVAQQHEVPALVSLETPMACGVGICFTCVAKIRDKAGHVDYRRTCVEGPVFEAALVEW